MRTRTTLGTIKAVALTAVLLSALAITVATTVMAAPEKAKRPVVLELFTSQSCYSCPPAEELFARLADDPDVITLEWHVDYWNDLVYGRQGRWEDPYSSFEYTKRQRQYNQAIKGRPSAYTPQAVIQGQFEVIGSDAAAVNTRRRQAMPLALGLEIAVRGDTQTVSVKDIPGAPADVWLVSFIDQQTTDVPNGENAGKTLQSRHVVTGIERLGSAAEAQTFSFAAPAEAHGCAVLVQEPGLGAILDAVYCK